MKGKGFGRKIQKYTEGFVCPLHCWGGWSACHLFLGEFTRTDCPCFGSYSVCQSFPLVGGGVSESAEFGIHYLTVTVLNDLMRLSDPVLSLNSSQPCFYDFFVTMVFFILNSVSRSPHKPGSCSPEPHHRLHVCYYYFSLSFFKDHGNLKYHSDFSQQGGQVSLALSSAGDIRAGWSF